VDPGSGRLTPGHDDYWEDKIDTAGVRAFGLPWRIFSRDEIAALMRSARDVGLTPVETSVPACVNRPVFWQDRHYTFIAMLFKKCGSQQ
jgi:hypothetical protein